MASGDDRRLVARFAANWSLVPEHQDNRPDQKRKTANSARLIQIYHSLIALSALCGRGQQALFSE